VLSARPRSVDDERRLAVLREVVLEAAALRQARQAGFPVRSARAEARFKVTLVRDNGVPSEATTLQLSADGIALSVINPPAEGEGVTVRIDVPGGRPIDGAGEVVWREEGSIGIQFDSLAFEVDPSLRERLVKVILEETSLLRELKEEVAKQKTPSQPPPRREEVLVELSDPHLAEATVELFRIWGLEATTQAPPSGRRPRVVVSDPVPGVPLAFLDVNAPPPAVRGLRPVAVVRHPVSAGKILEAVESALAASGRRIVP
jgi:hypothetical protein